MKRILFQGDSITDCARSRDNDSFLGGGYPLLIDGELGVTYPNEHLVINRGVSGDRIVDIYARMKKEGCVSVIVHTGLDEMHAPARRAYEKSGFSLNLPSIMYYRPLKPDDVKFDFKPTNEKIEVRVATSDDWQRIFEIAAQQWTIINNNYKDILGEELYYLHFGTQQAAYLGCVADCNQGI